MQSRLQRGGVQENDEQKDGNIYDSPDSGDSLQQIPDDLLSQNDKDDEKEKCHPMLSSPELSSRLVQIMRK